MKKNWEGIDMDKNTQKNMNRTEFAQEYSLDTGKTNKTNKNNNKTNKCN